MRFAPRALQKLEHAYRNTIYRVRAPAGTIDLRIDQCHADLDRLLAMNNASRWAIVTAFNPHSVRLSNAENLNRHGLLVASVRENGWTALDAQALPPDKDWPPEHGLLILEIAESDAVSLATRLQQNAIVAGELDRPARLVWIDGQRRR